MTKEWSDTSFRNEPWIFRAACHAKKPNAKEGAVIFGLILDLGFYTYKQIVAQLEGVIPVKGKERLVEEFTLNWIENGQPNPIEVCTLEKHNGHWWVHVYRTELDLKTLEPLGKRALIDALLDNGLVIRVVDMQIDA